MLLAVPASTPKCWHPDTGRELSKPITNPAGEGESHADPQESRSPWKLLHQLGPSTSDSSWFHLGGALKSHPLNRYSWTWALASAFDLAMQRRKH